MPKCQLPGNCTGCDICDMLYTCDFIKTTTMSSSSNPTNSSIHLTHPKYRAGMDGLRAVAVFSLVGFYALNTQFHGMEI